MWSFKTEMYREMCSLKYQLRNFILSLGITILLPLFFYMKSFSYISANMFALICILIVPLVISIQFINASILEERRNNTLELLFTYGFSEISVILAKLIPPIVLANIFGGLSIIEFKFIISKAINIMIPINSILLVGVAGTLLAASLSLLLGFLIKNENYYQSLSVLFSFILFGITIYFVNPLKNGSNPYVYIVTSLLIFIVINCFTVFLMKRSIVETIKE